MQFLENFKLKFNYLVEARPTLLKIENTLKLFDQVMGDVKKSRDLTPVNNPSPSVAPTTSTRPSTRKYDYKPIQAVDFANIEIAKPMILQSKPIKEAYVSPEERLCPELSFIPSIAKEVLNKENSLRDSLGKAVPIIIDWSFTLHPSFTSLVRNSS